MEINVWQLFILVRVYIFWDSLGKFVYVVGLDAFFDSRVLQCAARIMFGFGELSWVCRGISVVL